MTAACLQVLLSSLLEMFWFFKEILPVLSKELGWFFMRLCHILNS